VRDVLPDRLVEHETEALAVPGHERDAADDRLPDRSGRPVEAGQRDAAVPHWRASVTAVYKIVDNSLRPIDRLSYGLMSASRHLTNRIVDNLSAA
jgi:hypothetical protein